MKEQLVTDAEVRRFLLGDVDDSERQRIESIFISDAESNEQILLAEDDLFEDYFENSLTAADKNKFLAQYGHTPRQRRKLRIARSVKEYAIGEAQMSPPVVPADRTWDTFLAVLRPRNLRILVPVAAILIIVCVVAGVWLMESRRLARENARRLAVEQELASVNERASVAGLPPGTLSLVLSSVSVRSVQSQNQVEPGTETQLIELRLIWSQKQFPGYRALLRRVGSDDQYTVSNLQVERDERETTVPLRVPPRLLTRGLYQVVLSGIDSNGTPGQSEEYTFTVGR